MGSQVFAGYNETCHSWEAKQQIILSFRHVFALELSYPEYAVGISAVVLYGFKVCFYSPSWVRRSQRRSSADDFQGLSPADPIPCTRKTSGKSFD